jgi:(2Fe-2S) ferredoxin
MSNVPTEARQFYDPHVFICQNQRPANHPRGCCRDKGSQEMHAYMKARAKELGIKNTRINQSGCLERCEMGPSMVVYPGGVWYTYRTKEDIDEILQSHLIGGKIVTRLQLMNSDKFPKDREARLAASKAAAE